MPEDLHQLLVDHLKEIAGYFPGESEITLLVRTPSMEFSLIRQGNGEINEMRPMGGKCE